MPDAETPDSTKSQEAAPLKPASDADDPLIPRWVKTAGAVAAIFFGFYQIMLQQHNFQLSMTQEHEKELAAATEKAKADSERAKAESLTAALSRDEQSIKLQIAHLALDQHQAEMTRDEAIEDKKEAKESDTQLSQLISRIFSSDHSAEGDLAQLSDYIPRDGRHRTAILDAVAAKLADPRSVGEVHIAFRLIDAFGLDAQDLIIDSNRIARQRFDQIIASLFWIDFRSRLPVPEERASTVVDATVSVINDSAEAVDLSTLLQKRYQLAILNQAFHEKLGYFVYDARQKNTKAVEDELAAKVDLIIGKPDPAESKQWRTQAMIQAAILSDSVASLQKLLGSRSPVTDMTALDLSNCYLAGIHWPSTSLHSVDLRNAYVSGGDFSSAILDPPSYNTLVHSAVGIGTGNLNPSPDQTRRATDTNFVRAGIDPSVKISEFH
jgi:hypothetical protein